MGPLLLVMMAQAAAEPAGLSLVAGARDAAAFDGSAVPMMALVTDASGRPVSGRPPELTADVGSVGPVRDLGDGTYRWSWAPPSGPPPPRANLMARLGALRAETSVPLRPAPDLRTEPADLILGESPEARILVRVPGPSPRLTLTASIGRIGPLKPEPGPGLYSAAYTPPTDRFPQIALISLHDDGAPAGRLALPLKVREEVRIRTEPGARLTASLAGRPIEPVALQPAGDFLLPILLAPGESLDLLTLAVADAAGNERRLDVDLEVPVEDIFSLRVDPPVLTVGTHPFALVTLRCIDKSGRPLAGQAIVLEARSGAARADVTPVVDNLDGTYGAFVIVPQGFPTGPFTVSARTQAFGRALTASAPARLDGGLPASYEITPPARIVADGRAEVALAIKVADSFGAPMTGLPLELLIKSGEVRGITEAGGRYTARFVPSEQAAGGPFGVMVRLRTPAVLTSPESLSLVRVGDEIVAIARDASGRALPGVPVEFGVNGAGKLPPSATTDAVGQARATLEAPGEPGLVWLWARIPGTSLNASLFTGRQGSSMTPPPGLKPFGGSPEAALDLHLLSSDLAARDVVLQVRPLTLRPDGISKAELTILAAPGLRVSIPQPTVGQVGEAVDRGDGTYTATYTAPLLTRDERVTLVALAGGIESNSVGLALMAGGGLERIAVSVEPARVVAGSGARFRVRARLLDAAGLAVSDPLPVDFTFGGRTVTVASAAGSAETEFTALEREGTPIVRAESAGRSMTVSVAHTVGDSPAGIQLTASSASVATGQDAALRASVRDAQGEPVPDGTVVTFALGTVQASASTVGGVAQAALAAPAVPGTYTAVAAVGALRGQAQLQVTGGAGTTLKLTAIPDTVPDTGAPVTLTAILTDGTGQPVADGTSVSFTLGAASRSAPTSGGKAEVQIAGPTAPGSAQASAESGGVTDRVSVSVTVGPASTVALTVPVPQVRVNERLAVKIEVRDAHGHAITDASSLQLSALLGLVSAPVAQGDGSFAATFTAGTAPGNGSITAQAGALTDRKAVTVLPAPPNEILLTAVPTTLIAGRGETSVLEVQVRDAFGNLIEGEFIDFAVSGPAGAGTIAPAFKATDGNGTARVTYTAGAGVADFTVRAEARSRREISAVVTIRQVTAATRVVVIDATEPAPGSSNRVDLSVEVRDAAGNLEPSHLPYTARLVLSGSATTSDTVLIPSGTARVTVAVTDRIAEAVTVSLEETSSTGLAEVPGTARFIPGPAARAEAGSGTEPSPGDGNAVTLTVTLTDVDGNLQPAHGTAVLSIAAGGASVSPNPLSIPDGASSGSFTVSRAAAGSVAVTLTETGGLGLATTGGAATFIAGKAVRARLVGGAEPSPGSSNAVAAGVRIEDGDGNLQTAHAAFRADLTLTGSAVTGSTIDVPPGSAVASATISDARPETVTVGMRETTALGLALVSGTASFISGPAARVVVIGTAEPSPWTADEVAVTVRVLDADGNLQPSHPAYSATVSATGSAIAPATVNIPDGSAAAVLQVRDDLAESVTVSLTETSATGLVEVAGAVAFLTDDAPVRVVAIPVVEASPGSADSVTMTFEVRDSAGRPQPIHASYAARLFVTGSATIAGGATLTIPSGVASVTKTLTDTLAESVTVTLMETSGTALAEENGTATFIAGPASVVRVFDAMEANPGTADSVSVTIRVVDAAGNPQTAHDPYTATVGSTGSAVVVGSPITIPAGASSTTVMITDTATETVTVSLTETSGTTLAETAGTVRFIGSGGGAAPGISVAVLDGTEPAPGTLNRITLAVQVRDAAGQPTTIHPGYTARILATGFAVAPATLSIPSGTASVTFDVTDPTAESVTVSLEETSGTSLAEVSGTATFVAGTAARVRVRDGTEVGTVNRVAMRIDVLDADGNPQTSHPAFTGTASAAAPATVTGNPISIPDGASSAFVNVRVSEEEDVSVAVTVADTSGSGLALQGGTAWFRDDDATQAKNVVVLNGAESSPGDSNQIVLTVEVQRKFGSTEGNHPPYTAAVLYSGHATGPDTISIPEGFTAATITVSDAFAETVTVTLIETSGTNLTEVAGTAVFIAGSAARAVVRPAVEAPPGTSNAVNMVLEIQDADGNAVVNHPTYTATVASSNPNVTVATSPVTVASGLASATITVNDADADSATISLTETTSTGLLEVNGLVEFIDLSAIGPVPSSVTVVGTAEPAPGTANSVSVTIEVRDQFGAPIAAHVPYAGRIAAGGFATLPGGNTISIPDGTSSVTVTVDDAAVETVSVTVEETSGTNLTEVAGTVQFIAGGADRVRVIDVTEAAPGTGDQVTVRIMVQDADGNPQSVHADYTATVAASGANAVLSAATISLPVGVSETTITVTDAVAENVTVTLTETSVTALTEVAGIASFISGPPAQVVVVGAVEPAPGSANSLTLTVQVRDAAGNPQSRHPAYAASVVAGGSATVVGSPLAIPDGTAQTTVTINDTAVEAVSVSLSETSASGLTAVAGTATFITGPAAQVVVQSVVEPAPGTIDSVTVSVRVLDAGGNLQTSHPAYTALVSLSSAFATAVPSSVTIPDGTGSIDLTISDARAEVVGVFLVETSATGMTEVSATATFLDDPPVAILLASPVTVPVGGTVHFDASRSYALDPFVLNGFFWDFDGNGTVDSTWAVPPARSYPVKGIYTARLVVTDTGGYRDAASVQIFVAAAGEPAGPIALAPDVIQVPADGVSLIRFSSGPIAAAGGLLVADGTLVTLFTDRGALAGIVDAGAEPGVQVATSGGRISFSLQADAVPGTATVTAEAVAGTARGSRLVRFSGASAPPFVVDGSPSGAVSGPVDAVRVRFNKEIQPGTLNGVSMAVVDGSGTPVLGSLSYEPANLTAVFRPAAPLAAGAALFTVRLSAAIRDPDGNALEPFVFSFGAVGDDVPPVVAGVLAAPSPFSPDGDGTNDATLLRASADGAVRWRVSIDGGRRTLMATGPSLEAVWDGRDESGLVVEAGLYAFEVTAWDAAGNASAPVSGSVETTSPIVILEFGP